MALTATQINELNIASARKAAGNASATDLANLSYAAKTYGYKYTPPSTTPPASSPAPAPATKLATATTTPTATKTGTNTLLAYDTNNNNAPVYVTPGQYYKGIAATPDYSKVNTIEDANKAINAGQKEDAANANASGEPETKKSYSDLNNLLTNIIGENKKTSTDQTNLETIQKVVTPETAKPATVNLADTYTGLRDTYGVTGLETQLTDLQKQKQDLLATRQARVNVERNKGGVAQNVIEGRISKVEQQENERITAIDNQISTVTNQLNTKYSVVGNIMQYKGTDYTNAVNVYDHELATNLSIFNTLKGMNEADKNDQQRQQDNARASLQIVYNSIMTGGVNMKDLPADTKTLVNKLEVQAGLPLGFYNALQSKNPKSEVVATYNWTGKDGKEYASVLTKDPDTGQIKTNNIVLGTAKASSTNADKPTSEQLVTGAKTIASNELKKRAGENGKVSPQTWNEQRQLWVDNTPYKASDFDDYFSNYIDPSHPQDYTGFENYKKGMLKMSTAEMQLVGAE